MEVTKARTYREMLEGDDLIVSAGAYDGYSARLIEKAGFKMMAKAGALPPEILLKKEIAAGWQRLREAEDEAIKLEIMRSLANLQMRLAMMLEQRR